MVILKFVRKMEFRIGKETSPRGGETNWDISVVIQRKEEGSLS